MEPVVVEREQAIIRYLTNAAVNGRLHRAVGAERATLSVVMVPNELGLTDADQPLSNSAPIY
jgi:hypothetical protein